MATALQIREALDKVAGSHPDEARLLREHLDALVVHPMVLAERAIRATESASRDLSGLDERLGKIEEPVRNLLAAEAQRIEAEALLDKVRAEERQAALARSQESGQWFREGVTAIAGWLGKRSEAAIALILGALAAWFAGWLGVSP